MGGGVGGNAYPKIVEKRFFFWCQEGLPWPWKVWFAQGLSKNMSNLGVRHYITPLIQAPLAPPIGPPLYTGLCYLRGTALTSVQLVKAVPRR